MGREKEEYVWTRKIFFVSWDEEQRRKIFFIAEEKKNGEKNEDNNWWRVKYIFSVGEGKYSEKENILSFERERKGGKYLDTENLFLALKKKKNVEGKGNGKYIEKKKNYFRKNGWTSKDL